MKNELNELKDRMDQTVFRDVKFSEQDRQRVGYKIRRKRFKKRKNPQFIVVGITACLLLIAGFLLFDYLASPAVDQTRTAEEEMTIEDPDTQPVVENVENITSETIIYDYRYDSMDRGNREYYAEKVVIDPAYYEENDFKRGDVIAYEDDDGDGFILTRVVGLPGENVKIEEGQLFIDGKKLDTFYGRAHRLGMDLTELRGMLEEGDYGLLQSKENLENNIRNFESTAVEEVTVPEDHVYVMGDDWFRTPFRGPLPAEQVTGKVLGYES